MHKLIPLGDKGLRLFDWLKNISNGIEFKLAWSRQKSKEKKEHWDRLLQEYPAEALEADVNARKKRLTEVVKSKYRAKTEQYDNLIKSGIECQTVLKKKSIILGRDYEQELLQCYRRKEQIKRRHVGIKSDLSDAYERLKEAKDDVDAWHRKSNRSTMIFGNKGRKIPKHSLFGQSFGDLDAAKARRDEAAGDVGALKREKQNLSEEFESLNVKIEQIRDDRRQMRELQGEGLSHTSVEIELASLAKQLERLSLRSRASKRRGKRVLQRELDHNGVSEDQDRSLQMRKDRKEVLRQHMSPEEIDVRRNAFYKKWVQDREGI